MIKYFTAEKEINGKVYKAQFNGLSAAYEALDRSYIDGTDITSSVKMAKYLLDNVIVEPKMSINDFGADKIGNTKEKTINGVKYVAKFDGALTALKSTDNCRADGTKNLSMLKMAEYLFENIIVEPANLNVDDFDNMDDINEIIEFASEVMKGDGAIDELNKVTSFASDVMQGNFRPSENKGRTKKSSSK